MPSGGAEYMREYRARNTEPYDRQKRGQKAYRRALVLLRGRHPDEFRQILDTERAAVGLPPMGVLKPGPRRRDDAA
jgi:hypothetical protein